MRKHRGRKEGLAPAEFGILAGYASPYEMGRAHYKYTDCGPWTVFHCFAVSHSPTYNDPYAETGSHVSIYYESEDGRKSWEQLESEGITEILAVEIGSIVEGIEACADPVTVDLAGVTAETYNHAAIDAALDSVNEQCNLLWQDTHGCEKCAEHFGISLDDGLSPVWTDCPECNGDGVVI